VPADQPAVVNPVPAAGVSNVPGATPPDQMDNTGPEPQQPTEEQVQEQKDEEEENAGGGGEPFAFKAPKGHGKKASKPNRAERAMTRMGFTAPLGRRAA
jgi:hypothetical protein